MLTAALLAKIPPGEGTDSEKFIEKFFQSITASELFIYSAGFITPILYLLIERYFSGDNSSLENRVHRVIRSVFPGYFWLFFPALFAWIIAFFAYGVSRANGGLTQDSFLMKFGEGYSQYIYIYALFCWYLTLCDGCASQSTDYTGSIRGEERELAASFHQRISSRNSGESNE
jgi:hypothetical protein